MNTSTALSLRINGELFSAVLDHRTTLLDLLREHAGLTGAKKGCDHGQCGACTVLLDDRRRGETAGEGGRHGDGGQAGAPRRVNSCLVLAVSVAGARVTTVEGLADGDRPHPLQQAFVDHDAFQCGFCTPGQLCSGVAVIAEARAGRPSAASPPGVPDGPVELTAAEVRERMSGNLCRCGAYAHIVDAVQEVAR
ncbi:2Fe-2S iron-sulfur cluster-binding protein [Streptomyces sp. MST-110588]|uniref:(2Fe-2S)-binding protein n=1 Tax=Streptomyces sp. MST-110588 TaxID=2833628 RepID=UPI001F5E3270|nr:2Fe-2S iron-sulfur cluster-binding protein [Streptomyces sp. MST-110588]UNO38548.1 2Fe-2S iron-sulfur cluster binding domain-containing protein [Streptomyces sp. MST-110588]